MFDGLEIDMLSLGDADSILVTGWAPFGPQRILIDGGADADADIVKEFLARRNFTDLWAVVCTHLHGDHAGGLIKLVRDKSIRFATGWMHDVRNHVSGDVLRRASAGNSPEAEGVRQVVETTKELASAFASRGITPQEPFAGDWIAGYPPMTVLGPSLSFYQSALAEFTNAEPPSLSWPSGSLLSAIAALGVEAPRGPQFSGLPAVPPGLPPAPSYPSLAAMLAPPPAPTPRQSLYRPAASLSTLLTGALSRSSVKENPTTQPFNNTSVILGVLFNGNKLMLTADAGSKALARVPADWKQLRWMQVPHHGSDGNLSQADIERFCPGFAYISARGDASHPSRAIVSGLVKVGTKVFSTHKSGDLWFYVGTVPFRADYWPVVPLKGTGEPRPLVGFAKLLYGSNG